MRDKLRTLASDTLVYGTSTVVQRFLTFLLTPLYTNYLTMTELGVVANLYSLIAFANIVYSFGYESAFMRFYKTDADNRQQVFTQAFVCVSAVAVASSLVVVTLSNPLSTMLVHGTENAHRILMMAALIPMIDAFTIIPFARLRMQRQAKVFALLKLLAVGVNISMNILFVVMRHEGAYGVFVAGLISALTGSLVFLPTIVRSLTYRWDKLIFRQLSAFGLPTIPSGIASIMLQVADRPILLAMTDAATVGLYNANYRLGIPLMLYTSVFEYAWKPFYLLHADDDDARPMFVRIFTYFNLVAVLLFLLLSFFVSSLVHLPFVGGRFINESYWVGLHIVPVVAASYIFAGAATNYSAGLYITRWTKYLPLASGSAAIANVLLNIVLIPLMSYNGAAWATFGAYFVYAAVMYHYSQRVYPLSYEWGRILRILLSGLVVFCIATLYFADTSLTHILMRTGLIALFLLALWALRFFSASELAILRRLIRRRAS